MREGKGGKEGSEEKGGEEVYEEQQRTLLLSGIQVLTYSGCLCSPENPSVWPSLRSSSLPQ